MAAPDNNTPAGSYIYDWMRDGAISMNTFMILNNYSLSSIQPKMNDYVSWVIHA